MAQPTTVHMSFYQAGLTLADLNPIIASNPQLNHRFICAMAAQFEYQSPTALRGETFTEDQLNELSTAVPGSNLAKNVEKQLHHNLAGLKDRAQMMSSLLTGVLHVAQNLKLKSVTLAAFGDEHPDGTKIKVGNPNILEEFVLNTVADDDFLYYRVPLAARVSGGIFADWCHA